MPTRSHFVAALLASATFDVADVTEAVGASLDD